MQRIPRRAKEPWSQNEVNRIMMAARTMPDLVGKLPGRHFWPALLFTVMDMDVSAEDAVRIPLDAFDHASGRVRHGFAVRQLHAKTIEALNALPPDRERLLPWPKDGGRPPFHMLFKDYQELLGRAGFARLEQNSFWRLQLTARRLPSVLDDIEPILEFVPSETGGHSAEPWSIPELNRLVMSARTYAEPVGDLPGAYFWTALLLLILDVDISVEMAVTLPVDAFDAATWELTVSASRKLKLHSTTAMALQQLPPDRKRLLPWPKDNGRSPFPMLYRDYKTVLYRAGLPYSKANSFQRLQATARRFPKVIELIQSDPTFEPHAGKPQLIRARDRRRAAIAKNVPTVKATRQMRGRGGERRTLRAEPVLTTERPETLLNTFRSKYQPTKLRQASKKTVHEYERSLSLFYSFAGRELTFSDLTDDLVEEFLTFCLNHQLSPHRCNCFRKTILALWRFGWKKRLTNELPRDVSKLDVREQVVDAWTPDEMGRILQAAAELPGHVCGIPERLWWPAFLMTLYDTGLRVNALLTRKRIDLNPDTGWLLVDAADQKQKRGQVLKLHADTLRIIEQIHPADRTMLFPWPFSIHHPLRNRYRVILQAAGLPSTERDLFHKLRRTSATALASVTNEDTAREHLGHSNVKVTRRYIDPTQMKRMAASELIARPEVPSTLKGEPA